MNRPPRMPRRRRDESSRRFIPFESPDSLLGPLSGLVHELAPAVLAMGLADTMVIVVAMYSDGPPWVGTATPDQMGPGQQIAQQALDTARMRGGIGVLVLTDDDTRLILLTPPEARAA